MIKARKIRKEQNTNWLREISQRSHNDSAPIFDYYVEDTDEMFLLSEDAGTYTCTANNVAGTASTTAILDVPGELKSAYIK